MPSHVSGPMAPVAGRPSSDWMTETASRVAPAENTVHRDRGHLRVAARDHVYQLLRLANLLTAHPFHQENIRETDRLLQPFLCGLCREHRLVSGDQFVPGSPVGYAGLGQPHHALVGGDGLARLRAKHTVDLRRLPAGAADRNIRPQWQENTAKAAPPGRSRPRAVPRGTGGRPRSAAGLRCPARKDA